MISPQESGTVPWDSSVNYWRARIRAELLVEMDEYWNGWRGLVSLDEVKAFIAGELE
jgi:hypothetical protein